MAALRMASGIALWAAHFAVLYGFTGLACARGFGHAVPWVAGAATLLAFAATAYIALRALPHRGEFTAWMTVAIAGAAATAILYEAVALFIVEPCA
jgi:hypothetical protein